MTTTGLEVFDRTVQETNRWLKGVMDKLETGDRHAAYLALRATLHALRDRIGPENAAHLGAQLPTLVRGVYYEGWHMAATPSRERTKPAFLAHVQAELVGAPELDAEKAVRAAFEVMWEHIDPGEIAKLVGMFPMELRDLWPWAARAD